MCSRKITHSSPSSSGSLAQAFHNLPQRSRSVSPIAYPSVMSGSTVWRQGSASQLEVLLMIGGLYLLQRQFIRPAQVKRGIRVADAACLLEPLERLAEILGDAQALLIQPAQVDHGNRVAGGGGLFEPLARLAAILGDAPAVLIHFGDPSRIYHCFGLNGLADAN